MANPLFNPNVYGALLKITTGCMELDIADERELNAGEFIVKFREEFDDGLKIEISDDELLNLYTVAMLELDQKYKDEYEENYNEIDPFIMAEAYRAFLDIGIGVMRNGVANNIGEFSASVREFFSAELNAQVTDDALQGLYFDARNRTGQFK